MKHTRESVAAELKRIQGLVPQMIRDRIIEKAEMTPTIRKIALEAVASKETKQETREKVKILLESGELDKVKYVENAKYARMATNIVQREIKKSIKAGRLPSKIDNNLK